MQKEGEEHDTRQGTSCQASGVVIHDAPSAGFVDVATPRSPAATQRFAAGHDSEAALPISATFFQDAAPEAGAVDV